MAKIQKHGWDKDWCHICGSRENGCCADVFYPKNAEHDTHNDKYIRICGKCAEAMLNAIFDAKPVDA